MPTYMCEDVPPSIICNKEKLERSQMSNANTHTHTHTQDKKVLLYEYYNIYILDLNISLSINLTIDSQKFDSERHIYHICKF